MTIRATADNKFIRRYIFLATAGLGLFLWGVYDGYYAYPKKLEMAIAFDQIQDQEDAIHQWAELYEANKHRGWHREKPHDSADTVRGNINFSKGVAVAGIALLLYFLLKYFRTKSSWMESTDSGITTSWGQSLEFDKIKKINKRRWEAKGIAKVAYENEQGNLRTMVFDDFKYQRQPIGELMTMCEQNLSPDQIVKGKSQAEIAAEKENANEEELAEQDGDHAEKEK